MIQILGLRIWSPKEGPRKGKPTVFDSFHSKNWRAKSIPDLFNRHEEILRNIPPKERWNLFYTVAECGEGKRQFKRQRAIIFDVDGIDLKNLGGYQEVFFKELALPRNKVAVICSGNGLHFVIATKEEITDRKYFDKFRQHYKVVLDRLDAALKKADLPGNFDPKVWDARRILRLPGTVNRKPNKPDRDCYFISHAIDPISFDITALSGLPIVAEKDQVPPGILRKYPKVDDESIKNECLFMGHASTSADVLPEPQWYAWLSIVSRFEKPTEYAHEISSKHPGYTRDETDQKLGQAMAASGPRTCKNINAEWGSDSKCAKCPHFGKIISPINIVGQEHIKTELTGFHTVTSNGKFIPNYDDLRKRFELDFDYKGMHGSRKVMIWTGNCYRHMPDVMIEEYAQLRFDPKAKTNMVNEFRNLIQRGNIKDSDWWNETVCRKMNFLNGILDLNDWSFIEHTPDMGFRYVLPYEYEPDAKAPLFTRMLDQVTCGDQELAKVLMEFMGYCLSNDDCWTQKALVLVGEGANGKSTFMNVLKALAGKGNYGAASFTDLVKSEYSRALLDGKLFNISEETPTYAMVDSAMFKTMTTGGEIQVRSPYKEPYYSRNMAKLVFACNELPEVKDTSEGYYRRLIIVPFKAKFTADTPGYDPHIEKKLIDELPGIFNMAMGGYMRLLERQAFTASQSIKKSVEAYRQETDTVMAWMTENMHVNGDDTKFAILKDLYLSYKLSTESQGLKPVSRIKFTKSLRSEIPDFDIRYKVQREADTRNPARGLVGVIFGDGIGLAIDDEMRH